MCKALHMSCSLHGEYAPGAEDPLSRADRGRERANIPRLSLHIVWGRYVRFSRKRTFESLKNHETDRPLTADTVEKLRFEINGDCIFDLSVILYSRYEGVVEVV